MPQPKTRGMDRKPTCFEDVVEHINSYASLSKEVKSIFIVLIDFMKTIVNDKENIVQNLESKLEQERQEYKSKLNAMETELQQVKSQKNDLSSQITKLTNAHDDLEAYGRRESLIFSGDKIKPHVPDENCVDLAKDLIKSPQNFCRPHD